MKNFLIKFILWLFSKLPICWIRLIGNIVGLISYRLSKRSSKRLRDNLIRTKICNQQNCNNIAKLCAQEWGKTIVETACISWHWPNKKIIKLIGKNNGFDLVEQQLSNKKSILFLTPHIANFEIALKYTAYKLSHKKFTILYKPSKNIVIENLMKNGRQQTNIKPVPTNRHGVIALVKSLKNNEVAGLLPDNVASSGDGVWVDFFNNKVYAMTLAAKLSQMNNVATFLVSSIRTKSGFDLEYIPFEYDRTISIEEIVQKMYNQFEKMIMIAPYQYYWSYDRFRTPKHAPQNKK